MSLSYSELFNYLGGILGLLVSLVILAFTKRNSFIKISLSLLLITCSLIAILGAINYSGKVIWVPLLIRIDSPIHFLFGPAAYFYILTSFTPNFRFRYVHLLHLVPFLLNILFFMPLYLQSGTEKVLYYESWLTSGSYGIPLLYLSKTISGFVYFLLQVFIFMKYYPKNVNVQGETRYFLSWYYIYFLGQFILIGGLLADHISGLNLFDDPYRFAINMLTLFLFLASVTLLFFPQILYGKAVLETRIQKKYSFSSLTSIEKMDIMESLTTYMNSSEKPFRDPEITLDKLSKVLKIRSHRISQVVNEMNGMNFNDYLNNFRIEYAKKLLASNDYQKFTIDAIAREAGFNSRSPFYNAFKKQTGLTPRQFIINAENGPGKKTVDHER